MDSPANDPEMQKLIAMEVADIMEGMTTPTNWPDPAREGVPLFPERDGWHFIKTSKKEILPLYWDSYWREWRASTGSLLVECKYRKGWIYKGPVLTPTQIAERLAAERERCAAVLDHLKNEESEMYDVGLMTTRAEITIRAFTSGAEEIRNLGAAP